MSKIKEFLDRLDQQPLAVDGGRTLSQQQGVEAVFYAMYGGRGSGPGSDALTAAIFDGDGAGMLQLADAADRRNRDGSYGQLIYAFPAIRCLDSQDDSVRAAAKKLAVDSRRAPILGRLNGPDLAFPMAGQVCAQTTRSRWERSSTDRGHRYHRRSGHPL